MRDGSGHFIESFHGATPCVHLGAAVGAVVEMGAQFSLFPGRTFAVNPAYQLFRGRMFHNQKTLLRGGSSSWSGLSARLNWIKASTMRDFTVPSGMSRTSPISRNLRPS